MKIFLTVGTQLPFDRLSKALDAWCAEAGQGGSVFGQLGKLEAENYRPAHFEWVEWIDPASFRDHVEGADLLVSHAGMGSIITALSTGTEILILPRRAALREHRNDHQLATASRFSGTPGLYVADSEEEVAPCIDRAHLTLQEGQGDGAASKGIAPFADEDLISTLRDFIAGA